MQVVCTYLLLILQQSYNKKFQGSGFFETQCSC